jgi:hypothetical protein
LTDIRSNVRNQSGAAGKGSTRAKVTVEMLRVEKNKPPRLLHRLTHSTHSLEAVVATMENMLRSSPSATGANAFRITSDKGAEIYRGPNHIARSKS